MSCDYTKVQVGTIFSRHSFGSVIGFQDNPSVQGEKLLQVKNEAGLMWAVSKDVFEKEFSCADQFDKEIKLPATELALKFASSKQVAMTVCFNKKVEPKELEKKLLKLYPNKGGKSGLMSKDDFKKLIKEEIANLLVGEPRTMRGFHNGSVDVNGRIYFIDLEAKDKAYNMRLVDPRTIQWLIVENVKYSLKSK